MWNKETNRPENWENHYSESHFRKYLPFGKRGKEPYDIHWNMEDCEIAFEAGADAILKEAIEEGKRRALVELWE